MALNRVRASKDGSRRHLPGWGGVPDQLPSSPFLKAEPAAVAGGRIVRCRVAPWEVPDSVGIRFRRGVTNFHASELPDPPVFYLHNLKHRNPGDPLLRCGEWAGPWMETALGLERDLSLPEGELGERLWNAQKEGRLYCSSAASPEAFHWDEDGMVHDWGIVGVSLVDLDSGMRPKNLGAVVRASTLMQAVEELRKAADRRSAGRPDKDNRTPNTEGQMTREEIAALVAELMKATPLLKAEDVTKILADHEKAKADAAAAELLRKAEIDKAVAAEKAKWEEEHKVQLHQDLSAQARALMKGEGGSGPAIHIGPRDERTLIRRSADQMVAHAILGNAAWLRKAGYVEDDRAQMEELRKAAGFTSEIGSLGSFALQPQQYAEVFQIPLEQNFLIGKVFRQPMTSSVMEFETFKDWDRSNPESTGVYGGVVAHWIGEGKAPGLSEFATEAFDLKCHGLSLAALVNKDWLADAVAGRSEMISRALSQAAEYTVFRKFLWGQRVGTPTGILSDHNPALHKVTRKANGSLSSDDFDALLEVMLETSANWNGTPSPNLFYLTHKTNIKGMKGFTVGDHPAFVDPSTGLRVRTIPQYNNIPVLISAQIPKLGAAAKTGYWGANEKDLSLIDASYYVWGDREQYSVETLRELRAMTRQIVQLGYLRVGGEPIMRQKFTDENGDTTSWAATLQAK